MQLLDVYNDAIRDCTKATTLVNSTNEFYNNSVASNGTVYSTDIHSCVIDGAFLTLFMAFERFFRVVFFMLYDGTARLKRKYFYKVCFSCKRRKRFQHDKGK